LPGLITFYTGALNLCPLKNTIKIERAIKGLTQENLAKKISVSRQTINAMEANKYVPSTVLALKIAKVFDKAVEEIFVLEASD
jgi:putative transcriptional regulator